MTPERRLKAFEAIMKQIEAGCQREMQIMDDLKAKGKEKSSPREPSCLR